MKIRSLALAATLAVAGVGLSITPATAASTHVKGYATQSWASGAPAAVKTARTSLQRLQWMEWATDSNGNITTAWVIGINHARSSIVLDSAPTRAGERADFYGSVTAGTRTWSYGVHVTEGRWAVSRPVRSGVTTPAGCTVISSRAGAQVIGSGYQYVVRATFSKACFPTTATSAVPRGSLLLDKRVNGTWQPATFDRVAGANDTLQLR
ncbi:MAG: hypothetical protein NTX33_03785 [Propionibacteriales bacterium]|nr:hypothetical protein [Propionibacteriales bacterium]